MTTLPAIINRERIRELIPHAGSMCLLDRVFEVDATAIVCRASSHRLADNPLRHDGILPIHAGIEYCAQAIALHGQLTAARGDTPRRGYLAVIMNAEWTTDRLDTCEGELAIRASKLVTLQQGVSYGFSIVHQGHTLLEGQAVVALE